MAEEKIIDLSEEKKPKEEKKKEQINYLEDNEFVLKVHDKDSIKEISLKKYSLSIQIKLLKSGLLNKLVGLQKVLPKKNEDEVDFEKLDFVVLGDLLELSVSIIYEMLPKEVQLSKDKETLMDTLADGEPMRFITWIMDQFGRSSSFLAQENPAKEVANQPE